MHIVLINGSLRSGSTHGAVLKTALTLAPPDVQLTLYDGMAELPHFNPDDDREPLPPSAARLRALLGQADGVLFCTPEYAGALPGSFKNLLDWTVGEGLYQKPVAYINAHAFIGGAQGAHQMLRVVLGYVNADLIERACVDLPVRRDAVAEGVVQDAAVIAGIKSALEAMVEHIRHAKNI